MHEIKNQLKGDTDSSERLAPSEQGIGAFNLLFAFHPNVACLTLCWGHNQVTATTPPGYCKSPGLCPPGLHTAPSSLEMVLGWQPGTNGIVVALAATCP